MPASAVRLNVALQTLVEVCVFYGVVDYLLCAPTWSNLTLHSDCNAGFGPMLLMVVGCTCGRGRGPRVSQSAYQSSVYYVIM